MSECELNLLLQNHLQFIRTHRCAVAEDVRGASITGDTPGFPLWIPYQRSAELPDGCTAVRLVPWSGEDWAPTLSAVGFDPAEELSYMELSRPMETPKPLDAGFEIVALHDIGQAAEFAQVQAAGFLAEQDAEVEWWRECFLAMARRNVENRDQTFYLCRVDGVGAAVLLVVRTADVAGIYAVATKPEMRNRGLSAALLRRAVSDARAMGMRRVALQAVTGSYADRMYQRLGFIVRFGSMTWRRSKVN